MGDSEAPSLLDVAQSNGTRHVFWKNSDSSEFKELAPTTQTCWERLADGLEREAFKLAKDGEEGSVSQDTLRDFIATYPTSKQAGVLALLMELPIGDNKKELFVLLTTRGKNLRTHGGQTSLPGGKWDEKDVDIIDTAYREAHEEIGLPLPDYLSHICKTCDRCSAHYSPVTGEAKPSLLPSYVHTLGTLPPLPFHSLLVRAVIAFVSRPDLILPALRANPGEVDLMFLHPLENVLEPKEITIGKNGAGEEITYGEVKPPSELVPLHSEDWKWEELYHTSKDFMFQKSIKYKEHHFRTCATPMTGLTAEILIRTAQIAYNKDASFDRYTEGQIQDWGEMCLAMLK